MKKSFALLLGFVLLVSVCGVSLADPSENCHHSGRSV